MDSIINLFETALSYIGPFFVLLGLLIFVHELGHFLVAKFFGVKVEVFSLGFGKKIFQYVNGDTNYCISLIPLGGYVKMYGDDPSKEVPDEMRDKAFLLKPVGARIAIVLAGPLMNLFFAALVFSLVALIGENLPSPEVGDVKPDSPAYTYGFRSGDVIKNVNDRAVETWDDVVDIIKANPNDKLNFSILRSAETVTVSAETILAKNDNILSWERMAGKIDGLNPTSKASVVGVDDPNSPAGLAGFGSVELIKSINGQEVKNYRDLKPILKSFSGSSSLEFEVLSYLASDTEAKPRKISVNTTDLDLMDDPLASLGFSAPELFLYQIKKDSPAKEAGLKPGDRLISINNKKLQNWEDVVESVKSYKGDGKPLNIELARSGSVQKVAVVPKMTELLKPSGAEDNRFTIGIVPAIVSTLAEPVFIRVVNPLKLIFIGMDQSWKWTKMVGISFLRMIQNEVSSRNIGGVLTIGKYAGQSYQVGISPFLKLMAIISINLFILNLLPVPILDGGHLLFFTIEAIRGAPMSMKKMEVAQQVGLIILMTLMVFALFNDITNILNPPW